MFFIGMNPSFVTENASFSEKKIYLLNTVILVHLDILYVKWLYIIMPQLCLLMGSNKLSLNT